MKSLKNFILEAKSAYDSSDFFEKYYFDKLNYKYYNKETDMPTLEEIQQAYGTPSLMGDASFIGIDGASFIKVGNNKWLSQTLISNAFGTEYTDAEIFRLFKTSKKLWFAMLRDK